MGPSKIKSRYNKFWSMLGIAIVLALPIESNGAEFHGDAYQLVADGVLGATSMRLSGPRGFSAQVDSTTYTSETALPNGVYRYEIYGVADVEDDSFDPKNTMNNGRSAEAKSKRRSTGSAVIASGHFRILQGVVYVPGSETE